MKINRITCFMIKTLRKNILLGKFGIYVGFWSFFIVEKLFLDFHLVKSCSYFYEKKTLYSIKNKTNKTVLDNINA